MKDLEKTLAVIGLITSVMLLGFKLYRAFSKDYDYLDFED